jgi:hypothetical protein
LRTTLHPASEIPTSINFNPRDLGYHPPIAADAKIASGKDDEAISSIESSDRKRRKPKLQKEKPRPWPSGSASAPRF